MRAVDVMTTNVKTVTPDMTVHDLAAFLCAHGISGAPVVDAGGVLVGIVSESDLLHRAELGTARSEPRSWTRWFQHEPSACNLARDYLKSHARAVRDVMTTDVVTVGEMAFLDEIADLLETKSIRRLPVVREGRLVGTVGRANLVRALALAEDPLPPPDEQDDPSIRESLLTELRGRPWARVWDTDIMVKNRVVHLWYADDQPEEERHAIRVAAENTPGVARVEEHLMHVELPPAL